MKPIIVFTVLAVLAGCQSVSPSSQNTVSSTTPSKDARYFCEKELSGVIIQKQMDGQTKALCQFTDNTGQTHAQDADELLKGFAKVMIEGDTIK